MATPLEAASPDEAKFSPPGSLDLSQVTFVDSTGLGVIVGAMKRLRMDGGDLSVRGARSSIVKVFEITGVSEVLRIDDLRSGQPVGSL